MDTNLNTGWGTFTRLLMVQFTSNEGMSNVPPYVMVNSYNTDHHTRVLLVSALETFHEKCVGSLTGCETGPVISTEFLEFLRSFLKHHVIGKTVVAS